MARRFRTGSAGNYRRTNSPNLQRPYSSGVGFDTLHAQQRARQAAASASTQAELDAAQVAARRLCVICEGLDTHFAGCLETWGRAVNAEDKAVEA